MWKWKWSSIKWRYVFGMEGIKDDDRAVARILFYFFQFIILVIAFWLPFQRYLLVHQTMSQTVNNILVWIFWAIILLGILLCFICSNQRWKYLFTNWLYILIVLVAFPTLWYFGIFTSALHILRVIVLIYFVLPWSHTVARLFNFNKLVVTLFLIVLIAVFAGLCMSFADPQIGTPWNGIWWAFQTVTMLGYGDVVPNSIVGKLLAMAFMLLGIGLLAVLAASFTVFFIYRGGQAKETDLTAVLREVQEMHGKITAMERRLHGSGDGGISDLSDDGGALPNGDGDS